MAVLYRKYRPQRFAEVVGQEAIVRTLKNQVGSGSVAHAYLFTGSRGIGKTSVARILAKALNCEKPKEGEPCGKCGNCVAIAAGQFLDLVEIDAASNTGVDNIRELIEHVKFSPTSGKYKIFIIDEAHMLSKGAFNALLKTLEEPPRHAVFVLATTEANKLPATIISRTQRFDFKRFSAKDIIGLLDRVLGEEKASLPKEIVTLIAENAEGGGRDALSLLEKVMTLGPDATAEECRQLLGITDFALCQKLLDLVLAGNLAAIPEFVDNLTETGADFAVFNRDFLEHLREVLIYKVSAGQVKTGIEREAELKQQAGLASPTELIFIVRLFLKSYKDLATSPRGDIPLLLASLEAAQRKLEVGSRKLEVGAQTSKIISTPVKQPKVEITEQPQSAVAAIIEDSSETAEIATAETTTLEEVQAWWPKFIAELKKQNGPLASLIRTSSLDGVSGSAIMLGVKFNFDKQNLESAKNRALISTVIKEASGKGLSLRATVAKVPALESSDVNLADALKVFGGELVE